jgi:ATP-dependent Lon protease
MKPNRIPLFPLDVVLFPAMTLPLHIFEPRYKIMVARCLNQRLEFGIVLAEGKSVSPVGCTAEIIQKIKDYPDGRMDIVTVGRTVFRLNQVLEEKEYYEGLIEYLAPEDAPLDSQIELRLIDVFQRCHLALFARPWDVPSPPPSPADDSFSLAYAMAPLLPLELREKQTLLETRAENTRREFLLRWLSESLPKLLEHRRAIDRAGGNGHRSN